MAMIVSLGPPVSSQRSAVIGWIRRHWFVVAAMLVFSLPGLYGLASREWSTEQGAAGPIILVSGLWLLMREARLLPTVQGGRRTALPLAVALTSLLTGYLFAVTVGMLWLTWLCSYLTLVAILGSYIGRRGLARLWFPLVYLLFLVPPPYTLIAAITHSRKMWLSVTSVDLLSALGYAVAHNGTALYIDQYELLIADACAGMNSLISLLAIGLFYVYVMHRAEWRYAVLLAIITLPVAMVANLVRILLLLLATHYLNVEFALGPLHEAAGLLMFLVALACLIGVDVALGPVRSWLARR